jgi:tetratricopeptide (TPR) repeat protein
MSGTATSLISRQVAIGIVLAAVSLTARAAEDSSEWSRLDLTGLARQADDLKNQDDGASQLKVLAAIVADRFASSPPDDSQDWRGWLGLVANVGSDLPSQTKSLMAKSLTKAFALDGAGGAHLDAPSVVAVGKALISLGHGDMAAVYAKDWVGGAANLDDLSPECLGGMAKCLAGGGGYAKEARRGIIDIVSARYLGDAASVVAVSCSAWEDLVTALKEDMSEQERTEWGKMLRSTYGDRDNSGHELAIMHWVLQMLGDTHVNLFAADWAKAHNTWENWTVPDLVKLGRMLGWGYDYEVEPAVTEARTMIGQRMITVRLKGTASALSISPSDWQSLARCYGGALPDEARADWARKLSAAFVGRAMGGADLGLLLGALASLGDTDADAFAAAWLDAQGGHLSWSVGDYLTVSARISADSSEGGRLRQRLTEQFAADHLAKPGTTMAISPHDWSEIVKLYATDLDDVARAEWACKIFSARAADRQSMSSQDREDLCEALDGLGMPAMASVLRNDALCREKLANGGREWVACSPAWSDSAWQRLCWATVAAPPAQRKETWNRSVEDLPGDSASPAADVLAAVDKLTACLPPVGNDGLSAREVLEDLLQRSGEDQLTDGLWQSLEATELRHFAASLPEEAAASLKQAMALAEAGETQKAVAAYASLLVAEAVGANAEAAKAIRTELASLVIGQDPADLDAAERYIGDIVGNGETVPDPVWNTACRALLKRVTATPKGDRLNIWADGIARVSESGHHISASGMSDLDGLLAVVAADGDESSHVVLDDLLTTVPDLSSMVRLLQRRVAVLASEGNWQEARSAAALASTIADATPAGPEECVDRCIEIMKYAGSSAADLAATEALLDSRGGAGHTAVGADSLLADAARRALGTASGSSCARRLAYLHAFAGRADEAARYAHETFEQAAAEGDVLDALDDIQVLLRMSGSGLRDSCAFSQWLAMPPSRRADATTMPDGEGSGPVLDRLTELARKSRLAHRSSDSDGGKAGLAEKHLARRSRRLARWGVAALSKGRHPLAETCLAAAINVEQGDAGVRLAADSVVAVVVCTAGEDGVSCLAHDVVPLVDATAGRASLFTGAAVAHFNQDQHEQCIACLDSLEGLADGTSGRPDVTTRILRARSLIELARHDEAIAVLQGAADWTGEPEQCARAVFLIGWAHLRRNDAPAAIEAFREVAARFPETAVAKEAAQIVGSLGGS